MQNQSDPLAWRDGDIPVSTRFDDPFFSLEDGIAETQHVFLDGTGLPERFRDGFQIAELGFGTGLNFLVTAAAWLETAQTGQLFFTSFEAFAMSPADMRRAHQAFPAFGGLCDRLAGQWAGAGRYQFDRITLEVIDGDARDTLPVWDGRANSWYLDGFSPAKNPEMWGADLMAEVARHTAPGGRVATYTAAGHVRRGLEAAGFEVARHPGFGRKRHMTQAHF